MQLFKVTGNTIKGALLVTDKTIKVVSNLATMAELATDDMLDEVLVENATNAIDRTSGLDTTQLKALNDLRIKYGLITTEAKPTTK